MKDLVDVTQTLFALSRETAQIEAEAFELKQQVAVAAEVKSTLDSWVRHETNLREREQKQLAAYLIEKINKDLQDPTIQKQILDQAVADVESKSNSAIRNSVTHALMSNRPCQDRLNAAFNKYIKKCLCKKKKNAEDMFDCYAM